MAATAPDLERLRRFALAIALVLVTYSLAAVELDTTRKITPLGLPLKVLRPEWLPIGLMLASFYSLLRFWYYGVLKSESPARIRRECLQHFEPGLRYYRWTTPRTREEEQERLLGEAILDTFPRVPRARVTPVTERRSVPSGIRGAEVRMHSPGAVEDDKLVYLIGFTVPWRLRLAARAEDLDYLAPIWLNGAALIVAAHRLLAS